MQNPHSTTAVQWIRSYTLPQLTTGLVWYISFYAFDPNEGQLRRKRIRISPKIKKVSERKQYANEMIERITIQLRMGWNPWIKFKNAQSYATWQEACDAYRNQARHHSLLMTDLYTPHDIEEANEVIRHRSGDF